MVCHNVFDSNKVCGYIQAKENYPKRNVFLEYLIVKMLQYQDLPKQLGIKLIDLYNLPFSSLKSIFDIVEKYEKEYKQVFDEQRKQLEEQMEQTKQEFLKLMTGLQQKKSK